MIWAVVLAAVAGLAFWKRNEVKKGAEKASQMGAEGYKAARAKLGGEGETVDLTEEAAEAAGAAEEAAGEAAETAEAAAADATEAKADG